jgi:hypothetical protein
MLLPARTERQCPLKIHALQSPWSLRTREGALTQGHLRTCLPLFGVVATKWGPGAANSVRKVRANVRELAERRKT